MLFVMIREFGLELFQVQFLQRLVACGHPKRHFFNVQLWFYLFHDSWIMSFILRIYELLIIRVYTNGITYKLWYNFVLNLLCVDERFITWNWKWYFETWSSNAEVWSQHFKLKVVQIPRLGIFNYDHDVEILLLIITTSLSPF